MRTLLTLVLLLVASPRVQPEPGCFPEEAKLSDFENQWYCKQLKAAGEAELRGGPAYRFTYLPSFHRARIVVVSLAGEQPIVVGKVLGRKGGYDPGRLVHTTRRLLAPDEWRLLQQRIENAGMWEATDKQDGMGTDGAQWLLEGRDRDRYRLHDVWSPTESTFPQYRKACVYMLELAGILPDDHKLY